MVIRVGPAGWSYADWEGPVYPRSKPRGFHPLAFLARYVDCVELNSSFYALPNARHAQRWVELVREHPRFRFTAKLLGEFTHAPWSEHTPEQREGSARDYLAGLAPLNDAGRLAALLVQFPASFRPTSADARERLHWIRARFGDSAPLVLELRDRAWFEGAPHAELLDLGYSFASIDLPAAREHPDPELPLAAGAGPVGYLRLHGRNASAWFDPEAGRDQRYDYLYAADELADLVRTARRLAEGKDETYVVTNNHFSGKAMANALEILASLSGEPSLAPSQLVAAYPQLVPKTRVEGQGDLFGGGA